MDAPTLQPSFQAFVARKIYYVWSITYKTQLLKTINGQVLMKHFKTKLKSQGYYMHCMYSEYRTLSELYHILT